MNFPARLILLFLLFLKVDAFAQCSSKISTFPYNEDFEASDGGWVTGGNSSDWIWGAPQKAIITSAGSGKNCWIIGGLNGNSYNNNEQAWLQSPCFDFSNLKNPYISFLVFWETEYQYDGAVLQYSIDSGTTWIDAGTVNDTSSCLNTSWYNTPRIRYLLAGDGEGWSGATGDGNGSEKWVTATHTFPQLAGQHTVIFRFFFGAGSINNNYNGFAFDDFTISEIPPPTADFSFGCLTPDTYQFTPLSSACNASAQWNFGDTSSISDTSTQKNPVHTFTTNGYYNVTLTITSAAGVSSITKKITVLNAVIHVLQQIHCNGDSTGQLYTTFKPKGSYSYVWNTVPQQATDTVANLGAGTYSVVISGANTCTQTQTITLSQPDSLLLQPRITAANCNAANGSITVKTTGGTQPYSYVWANDTAITKMLNNVRAGSYSLTVTDANKCTVQGSFRVKNINPLTVSLGKDTGICESEILVLEPGSYASYTWQDGSYTPTYTVRAAGTYSVTVTDTNGCIASDKINIYHDCGGVYFPTAFTPNNDGLNDTFGPVGNLSYLTNYTLEIYNRWGNLVYTTNNPGKKWNGNYTGMHDATDTYTWFAKYKFRGAKMLKKGTVTVLY